MKSTNETLSETITFDTSRKTKTLTMCAANRGLSFFEIDSNDFIDEFDDFQQKNENLSVSWKKTDQTRENQKYAHSRDKTFKNVHQEGQF